jgi:hypothetical protein
VKRVLILGSTGSIGTQALEVIGASDGLQVAGLSADSSWERVLAQARDHGVPAVALADPESAERAAAGWGGQVLAGEDGVRELIVSTKPDLVLNAVVGAAGLGPTIVALTEGIDLALANKERLGALRALPADQRRAARHRRPPRSDRLRRAVSRAHRPLRDQHRRGARASHLGDGRQDHDRLGDADEQGLRDDRGPPPLRRRL